VKGNKLLDVIENRFFLGIEGKLFIEELIEYFLSFKE
jgi:hypothetical protein